MFSFYYLEKRLFNVYTSFNDASKDNAFCQDSSACIDILAECTVGPENASSKYCRCPDGYLNEEKKRCGMKKKKRNQSF